MCGGMPYELRELLKAIGWGIVEGKGSMRMVDRFGSVEIGKRAVVYGYWFRALMNGNCVEVSGVLQTCLFKTAATFVGSLTNSNFQQPNFLSALTALTQRSAAARFTSSNGS
jgi:hypothetical protein